MSRQTRLNSPARTADVSGTYAPLASPTFSGTVTVPSPSTANAAATRAYVDGKVAVVPILGVGIDTSGASDSTTAIQALITANPGRSFRAVDGATYKVSATITCYTKQTFDLTGSTWNWVGCATEMWVNYACYNPQRTVTDGATTASSTTVTSATAAFTVADVGRAVVVATAGPGGNNLCGNIVSVTSATAVVLDRAATASTSGRTLKVYDRDTDIVIKGGTFNRDATATSLHGILFRRADRIRVSPAAVTTLAGLYAVNVGDVNDFEISKITCNSVRDQIHVNGPANRGLIQDITGGGGDDTVSLTADDANDTVTGYGAYYIDTIGDIGTVAIRNITRAPYGVSNGVAVRVLAGLGCKVRNIEIDTVNIGGSGTGGISISDFPTRPTLIGNDCDNVTISNVVFASLTGTAIIELGGAGLGSVVVNNVTESYGGNGMYGIYLNRDTGGTLDLSVSNFTMRAGGNQRLLMTGSTSTWRAMQLSNIRFLGGAMLFIAATTPGPISLANCHMSAGWFVYSDTSTAGPINIDITNLRFLTAPTAGFSINSNIALNATIVGLSGTAPGSAGLVQLSSATASANVLLEACRITTNLLSRSASQSARFNGRTVQIDVSTLTPSDGDMVYNTNSGLGCGAGPVVYNTAATKWKHLYTGLTN